MSNEKVLALSKLFYKDGTQFVPSEKEQALVSDTVDLFRQTASARDRNFQYFDGLNLIEYIEDSVLRFNTNIDEREGIEDWQAGVHDPFTRNKVLGILGRVIEVLPIAEFIGRGDEDCQKGQILTNIYQFVEELDDYDEFMTHFLLEAIVKGTAIGYEDVEFQEKTYRDVKGYGDNISVTNNKETTTKLFASIVPLEEFYPSSVSLLKVKDMPYCFWRTILPYSKFYEQFGHYKKCEVVAPQQTWSINDERPYYYDFIDENVPDGSIEVIRYYDKLKDEFVIIANGIWLNPIKTKAGTEEEISPMPWNHKELPFFDVRYDLFGNFFYGKSLPDRLKSMQDVLNVLTNMLLDQSFLTIFPPLLTNGFDDIEDDYLRPGRRTPVDTQGLPISQAFQVLQSPTPSGWHQFILEYTRNVMEESSMDKVSQGVAGAGDRTTAAEIRTAASGVASMLQMFARMINTAVKRKALLKAANIIQFGFNTDAPILRQVEGEDASENAKKAFQVYTFNNTVLSRGKRGTKIIEIYKDEQSLPARAKIKARALIASKEQEKEVEIVALPPSYIRQFIFDVKLGTNPKSETSKDIEKALQLEKVRVYLSFFPELINKAELAAQTAEKMGDDPTKVLTPEAMGVATQDNTMLDKGVNTQPQGNEAANMANQGQGMTGEMQQMAQLQAQMTQ